MRIQSKPKLIINSQWIQKKDTSKQEFRIDKSQSLIEILVKYLDKKLPNFPEFFKLRFSDTYRDDSDHTISPILNTFLNTERKSEEISLFDFEREWKSSDVRLILLSLM